jgi:hypothetical protein
LLIYYCTGLSTRKCSITVPGSAGSQSSLQVQASEDGQYGVQKDTLHKVILRTIHMLNDSIWRDYTLPAVTVRHYNAKLKIKKL